jgi:gamma-glutamyl-gamma-aminobutyrate hydrolase PuuD
VPRGPSRYPALAEQASVNSFHNFCVRPPASSELGVRLCSEDGVAEAIEHETRKVLGIMWHPERYPKPRPRDLELFRQVLLS